LRSGAVFGAWQRGFTLVEMLIVMFIIGVITVVVITSQGTFNKTLILSNAAYDVALALRSAQNYGLGSRLTTTGLDDTGYGLEFRLGSTFTFFADNYPAPQAGNCHGLPAGGSTAPDAKRGNCIYDSVAPNQDRLVTPYTLNRGITVTKVCAYSYSGSWSCTSSGLTRLDIVFVRPDPAPFMSTNGTYPTGSAVITAACVTLTSPQGGTRSVSITSTGQINPAATSCGP
jgi:prepilin-type N-terminal cleavage/methylation domain-containing protein